MQTGLILLANDAGYYRTFLESRKRFAKIFLVKLIFVDVRRCSVYAASRGFARMSTTEMMFSKNIFSLFSWCFTRICESQIQHRLRLCHQHQSINMKSTIGQINMKSTIGQINEPGPLFWEQEWKYNGDLITAIHGLDESTKEFISSAPAGYVMISTRTAIPHTNRFAYDSVRRMVSPDAEITA